MIIWNILKPDTTDRSIKDVYKSYRDGEYIKPGCQRNPAWDPKKTKNYIISCFVGTPIGDGVPLRMKFIENELKYEYFDFQSRLKSLFDFIEDKIILPKKTIFSITGKEFDLSNLKFSKIKNKFPEFLEEYFFSRKISFKIYPQDTRDKDMYKLYNAINSGNSMTEAERRHAKMGDMRDFVIQTRAEHPFSKKIELAKGKENKRYQLDTAIAKILSISKCNDFFSTSAKEKLNNFYDKYVDLKDSDKKELTKFLDLLNNASENFLSVKEKINNPNATMTSDIVVDFSFFIKFLLKDFPLLEKGENKNLLIEIGEFYLKTLLLDKILNPYRGTPEQKKVIKERYEKYYNNFKSNSLYNRLLSLSK